MAPQGLPTGTRGEGNANQERHTACIMATTLVMQHGTRATDEFYLKHDVIAQKQTEDQDEPGNIPYNTGIPLFNCLQLMHRSKGTIHTHVFNDNTEQQKAMRIDKHTTGLGRHRRLARKSQDDKSDSPDDVRTHGRSLVLLDWLRNYVWWLRPEQYNKYLIPRSLGQTRGTPQKTEEKIRRRSKRSLKIAWVSSYCTERRCWRQANTPYPSRNIMRKHRQPLTDRASMTGSLSKDTSDRGDENTESGGKPAYASKRTADVADTD